MDDRQRQDHPHQIRQAPDFLAPTRASPDGRVGLRIPVPPHRAVWRRKPKQSVLVHSDQGSQFTGGEWQDFLKTHNLSCSMSRRGNCHDNAVAESFFQWLKRERIKRRIYATRDEARSDVFDYIEMFYNPIRRHGSNDGLSPVEFERQFIFQQQSV